MLILVATVSDVSAIQLSGDERLWRDQLLHRPTHNLELAVDALGTKSCRIYDTMPYDAGLNI